MTEMLSDDDKRIALISIVMASRQSSHLPAFSLQVFDVAEKLAEEWGLDLDLADAVSVVSESFEAN